MISGLTGVLLSFYIGIERSFHPLMQTETPYARPSSYEDVFRALQNLPMEPGNGRWSIEIPREGGVITARYSAPGQSFRMISIDPVTLELLRDAAWGKTFFSWIYDVHMNLKLGPSGRIVMGIACLAMAFMLVIGLVNWLLQKGRLSAKLRFARNADAPRRLYDLHVFMGLPAFVFLFLTIITGAMMSLPAQTRTVLGTFSALSPTNSTVQSTEMPGAQRIPVDQAMTTALARFPGGQIVWVRPPIRPTDTYGITMLQADDPVSRWPRTQVWVDQYSGAIADVYDARADTAGDTILEWVIPLHEGLYLGITGRVITMLIGFVSAAMFVTGFLRWRQRRRRRTAAPGI